MSSASRVMVASGTAAANGGTSAVADEHRPHADALGAVHVVEGPVADEHAGGRVVLADGGHRGTERLGVRLGPGQFAGVHGAVDQVEHLVPDETPVMHGPGPQGVGQHPDPDAPAAQFAQQRGRVRVGERVRLPRLEVAGEQGLGHGHPGALEDLRERGTLLGALDALPHRPFGRADGAGHLRRLGLRIVPCADPVPESLVIDAVPRGERPAPVEDDRPYRHVPILRAEPDTSGRPEGRQPRGPSRGPECERRLWVVFPPGLAGTFVAARAVLAWPSFPRRQGLAGPS